ncbi:palmitoyl-acyl carrier protein thioesterase, chloroplastic-like [Chenopodium quinoa]|uniref:palmitoyl-acyl carrier protein thioesterase, chloroplastic-like n=1 Tax=Chenopodium quinoa TaxID=63459 RepID=UPI000B7877B6|nr:palmitoyl-acyl carrier protein thioesterase, chloroplastic-like [Chenopodium quinoa]
MPAISGFLSSFPLMVPPSKLMRGRSVDNNNAINLYNFGTSLPSHVTRLQVKVDNFQDPLKINNFGKTVNHELEKRRFTQDGYVVGQNFLVRLYELDIHEKASLEALLNYTQETGLNLFQSSGLRVEGFGVSKEMTSRNLIWVIGRMQVEVDSYPSWGDIVQVETWCSGLTKHCLTCSSRLTDANTGTKIMRVDSEFVMINEKTRRLSRIPEEIKASGDPYVKDYLDPPLNVDDKLRKLRKLDEDKADYILRGIKPLWFDLDPNQHVNNVKYISWILEGTPEAVRENYELSAFTLEYRRECGRNSVLQSLSGASNEIPNEYYHLLRLENGNEVARARTLWRKSSKIISRA